jgi:hypothetical protein
MKYILGFNELSRPQWEHLSKVIEEQLGPVQVADGAVALDHGDENAAVFNLTVVTADGSTLSANPTVYTLDKASTADVLKQLEKPDTGER